MYDSQPDIYKLNFSEHTMRLHIDVPTMMKKLGEFNFVLDATPRLPIWEAFQAEWQDGTGSENMDVAIWQRNLCFSPESYLKLASKLKAYGEFLPITVEGETWHIFNITHTLDADPAQSRKACVDGEESTYVEAIGFLPDQEDLIFKSTYDGCMGIYCQDSFIEMVKDLTGIEFSSDLRSI
ncbi:MAG: hypothetical protein ACR2PX_25715 [Endozoicomonas sp.]|uniref:hypothetical protein n=1 Tax=Endozoicomonas sp. TaxID=1892382 RepID=UPI003D9BFC52